MSLNRNIADIPFLRILPPVVLGILAAGTVDLPAWAVWGCLLTLYAMGWAAVKHETAGRLYVIALLVFTGIALTRVHATRPQVPQGEKLLLQLRITDNPAPRGRWNHTTARVGYYRAQSETEWHAADQKILLAVDTCYRLGLGDQLICRAYMNPVDRTGGDSLSGYARLMNVRGVWGRAYLTPGNLVVVSPGKSRSPAVAAGRMQQAAAWRLARLPLSPENLAVATAMATGERRALPPELRAGYGRVGASHLLTVSGLHVGIVFVLVNCLLWLLPVVRRGHILKNILAVAAIWAFAAMTGLSPSALRAALMFTGAQAALAGARHYSALNILLATATVMLLLNPYNLWDVSFQLSMLAVLGIALIYRPLYARLRSRWRALNFATGVMIVGLAATVATAPAVACHFHNLPLLGLLINVPVIVTAHIVVLLSLLWIVAPVPAMAGIMGRMLDWAVGAQNAIVEWCARIPGAGVEVHPAGWQVALVYAAYLAVLILCRSNTKEEKLLSEQT